MGTALLRSLASLVSEVTDDKKKPKQERKDDQVQNASKISKRAKILKLGNKTSNMRAIAFNAPPNRSVKRRVEYVRWAKSVVAGLRRASPLLEEQFDRAAEEAARASHVPAGSI